MKIPQKEGEGKTWRMNKRQDVELALRRSGGSQSQKKGIPLIVINEGKRTSHEKKLIGAHRRAAGKSFSKVQGWHNAIKTGLARRHPPHRLVPFGSKMARVSFAPSFTFVPPLFVPSGRRRGWGRGAGAYAYSAASLIKWNMTVFLSI